MFTPESLAIPRKFMLALLALAASGCARHEIFEFSASGEGICAFGVTELAFAEFVGAEEAQVVTLRNVGEGPVEAQVPTELDGGTFRILGGGAFVLEPDQVRQLTIIFAPSTTGPIATTLAALGCRSIELSGVGLDPPVCAVSTAALDFGTISAGDPCPERTFNLRNDGVGRLEGTARTDCDEYVILGNASYSLDTGEDVDITVLFAPRDAGVRTCEIDVGSPFFCSNVSCSGTSTDRPIGLVTSDTGSRLSFGSVLADGAGGQSLDLGFTVTNVGTGAETLDVNPSFTLPTNPAFTILNPGSVTLTPGQTVAYTVQFDPVNAVASFGPQNTAIIGLGGCALAVEGEAQVTWTFHVDTLLNACRGCHDPPPLNYSWTTDRIDPANPSGSVLLQKASASVFHSGGNVWPTSSTPYLTTLRWIEGGAAP